MYIVCAAVKLIGGLLSSVYGAISFVHFNISIALFQYFDYIILTFQLHYFNILYTKLLK